MIKRHFMLQALQTSLYRTRVIFLALLAYLACSLIAVSLHHSVVLTPRLASPSPGSSSASVPAQPSSASSELPAAAASTSSTDAFATSTESTDIEIQGFVATSKVLTDLVAQKNPTAAFAKLKSLVAQDPKIAVQCHNLSHAIGDAAYLKYGSFTAAYAYNDFMCGSGYIHSLVVNAFKETDNPTPIVKEICAGQDGYCYHGIGHGLMFFTHNDVPKAVAYCNELNDSEDAARCSEGVFMQNFEAGQDDPTPYVYATDPLRLCRDEPRYKTACYLYAGSYLATGWRTNPDIFSLCDASETKFHWKCISGMGAYLMAVHLGNPKQAEQMCDSAKTLAIQNSCIDGLVSYDLVNYNSIPTTEAFCASLEVGNRKTCENSLDARRQFYQ